MGIERLFIGGTAHGSVRNVPEKYRIVQVPEPVEIPRMITVPVNEVALSNRIQVYELRRYEKSGVRNEIFVLRSLSDDETDRLVEELNHPAASAA